MTTRPESHGIIEMSDRHAFLLIDHGSRRAEANEMLGKVADLVRAQATSDTIVEAAHMELAEPTIQQAFARCVEQGATLVVAHPFMLSRGRHVAEDVPRLVAEAAALHPDVRYAVAEPLGGHPGIAAIVLDRCKAALEEA